jgi:hypothetical protein
MFHPKRIFYKSLLEQRKKGNVVVRQERFMSKKLVDEKHSIETLKEMIEQRKTGEPVEEVLATFCQRYSLPMETCQSFYDGLVKKGQIKEK